MLDSSSNVLWTNSEIRELVEWRTANFSRYRRNFLSFGNVKTSLWPGRSPDVEARSEMTATGLKRAVSVLEADFEPESKIRSWPSLVTVQKCSMNFRVSDLFVGLRGRGIFMKKAMDSGNGERGASFQHGSVHKPDRCPIWGPRAQKTSPTNQ